MEQKNLLLAAILALAIASSGVAQNPSGQPLTMVVLIAGFDSDASPDQMAGKAPRGHGNSGMYQLAGDLERAGFKTLFFNWNGTAAGKYAELNPPGATAIVTAIRDACANEEFERLVLIGHSWGGHTMLEAAAALEADAKVTVDLAIGVDPSSLGRGERAKALPACVRQLVCFCSRNAFIWGPWADGTPAEIIDLGDPAHGYLAEGRPNYAATFDVNAHNAVEWDPRVHAAVMDRITRAAARGAKPTGAVVEDE
jgi:pimeloyl-ACP methyl ester carboxylesterase